MRFREYERWPSEPAPGVGLVGTPAEREQDMMHDTWQDTGARCWCGPYLEDENHQRHHDEVTSLATPMAVVQALVGHGYDVSEARLRVVGSGYIVTGTHRISEATVLVVVKEGKPPRLIETRGTLDVWGSDDCMQAIKDLQGWKK